MFTVVKVSPADFEALYDFWQQVGLWVYPVEIERQKFQLMYELHPSLFFSLQDKNKKIVGSIIGAFDGRTASIHRFSIHPDFQRQGFGKKLLSALQNELKKIGCTKLVAQVHESNQQVLGFYEKTGFEVDQILTLKKSI